MPPFRFDRFLLDPADRQLHRDGAPVELNSRYLDALTLLVGDAGALVSKDRFMAEVWRGVPVTDEALTQCIKTLRRQLGDDAANPRFIETVPKHGYRFIAPVEESAAAAPAPHAKSHWSWREFFLLGGAGTIGAGIAGFIGGLLYGFLGAAQPLAPGVGAASVLLVLLSLSIAVALIGGAGVAFGIAATGRRGAWSIAGGAAGGLVVGAVVKLLGIDAFSLLLGRSPGDVTGAAEGLLLGGAVGFGAWLGRRTAGRRPLRRSMVYAGAAGALSGVLIVLLGGRLWAGSLDLLARTMEGSRLSIAQLGALFGEQGFGPISQYATAALEGGLFGACIVGAMILAERDLDRG